MGLSDFDLFEYYLIAFFFSFSEPPVGRFSFRRKSVFAEQYDPENDDDEEAAKV